MPEKITSRLKISPWQIALCFALCCVVAMIAAGSFAKFNDKVSANEKQKPNKTKKFQVSPNKGLTPEESKQLSQMYSEWQNPNGERGNSTRGFTLEEQRILTLYGQGSIDELSARTLLSRVLLQYYYQTEPANLNQGYLKKKALLAQYSEFVRQQGRRILDEPRTNDKRPANTHINPNLAGGPDAFGYTFRDSNEAVNPPAFQFIDISATGTLLTRDAGSSADEGAATLPLGGPGFSFYGNTINTVRVSTNGYISTALGDSGGDLSNDCPLPVIPSTGSGARFYPLHDDLISANIRHQYFATSPRPADNGPNTGVNVISWINSDHFGGGTDAFSFQVLLYDNGDIVYQYGAGNPEAGSGSTTGIQDGDAAIGLTYACNTAATLADGLAILFSAGDGGGGGDCEPCTPDSNAFTDPSLEQEDTFWTSDSTNFGTGFCTIAGCGTGLGTGPRTGDVWWWGGGTDSAEVTTLSQDVTIPTGTTATLNFFLEIPVTETPFDATMVLTVDGDTINTYTEPSTGTVGYTLQTFDLSAYADGGTHTILFTYTNPSGSGTSNFFIDDLQLQIVCPPCEGDCTNPNVNLLVADTTNSRVQRFTTDGGMPTTLDVGPINGTFGTGDAGCPSFTTGVQDGRIFRDGVASTCPSKAYPGIFNVGINFNYDAYTFVNNMAAAQCITVNFDPDTVSGACTTNAHASAYLTSYNPASQATNFVGDVGSSAAQPFSFEVPANGTFLVVVTNTTAQATCSYQFTVVGDVSCAGGSAATATWSVLMPAGTTAGKVKNPKGVTQTSDGVNIYVADTGNNRIQKSTDSGATWAVMPNTTAAPLGFKSPAAVAVETDDPNVVYVADTGNNRVLASSDGGATWTILAGTGSNPNQVRGPEGLVVDCDGNLWIADTLNNRIVAYAALVNPPRGTRVAVTPGTGVVVAGLGSALNQVRAPKAVTVDVLTGDLYVADTGNNRVTHYTNGPVLTPVALVDASLVASSGSALGQVRSPAGITVSGGMAPEMVRNGLTKVANTGVVSLVIGDTLNNRIQYAEISGTAQVGAFALLKGTPAGQTATIGSAVGQFRAPTGVR